MSHTHQGRGRGRGRKPTRPLLPVAGRGRPRPRSEDGTVMRVGDADMLEFGAADAPEAGGNPEGRDGPRGGEDGRDDLKALLAERDAYLDLARRERADFDNYRKRMEREMGRMKRESLSGFLRDLITPLADLDRVVSESAKSASFETLRTGVGMLRDSLWQTLSKAGVSRIDAKGQAFDPALHEALTAVPSAEAAPNTVLEVYEAGYRLDDFVLRPARVVVSRPPDS